MKHSTISSLQAAVKKLHISSIIVGVIVGAIASVFLTCSLFGADSRSEYGSVSHHDMGQMDKNQEATATNPYMMKKVSSEKEFIKDMKLHHDAAVLMSQQLLALKDVHPEVRELAQSIIAAQMKEIATMNDWIKAWGH